MNKKKRDIYIIYIIYFALSMAVIFGTAKTMSVLHEQVVFCRAFYVYGLMLLALLLISMGYLTLAIQRKNSKQISSSNKKITLILFGALCLGSLLLQIVSIYSTPSC